jgi:hypothetical protein
VKVGHFKEDADFAVLLDQTLERRDEMLLIGMGQFAGDLYLQHLPAVFIHGNRHMLPHSTSNVAIRMLRTQLRGYTSSPPMKRCVERL